MGSIRSMRCRSLMATEIVFTRSIMHQTPNPFEPTTQLQAESPPANLETVKRIRFTVSMWVCGIFATGTIPAVSLTPSSWTNLSSQTLWNLHLAWITPFACGLASVITAICLFNLPRISDKIGAVFALVLVGLWPTMLAIYWWFTFAIKAIL